MLSTKCLLKSGEQMVTGMKVREMSVGWEKVKQNGARGEAKVTRRPRTAHIGQKDMERETGENKEREHGQENVVIAEEQDIGQEIARSPRSFKTIATIAAKKDTKQHSV
jgi:hypothetical protein